MLLVAHFLACGAGDLSEDEVEGVGSIQPVRQAITDGLADPDNEPVGLLRSRSNGTVRICSATLIGRRTVITAAHCLQPSGVHTVKLADYFYEGRTIVHPSWDTADAQGGGDIALMLLDTSPLVEPLPIVSVPPTPQMQILLVGWGAEETAGDQGSARRRAPNTVDSVDDQKFYFSGTGDGSGNVCEGDSGGAVLALLDEQIALVGVTGGGVPPCGTLGWAARVDVYRSWIIDNAAGDVRQAGVPFGSETVTEPRLVGGCEVSSDGEGLAPVLPFVLLLLLLLRRRVGF